MGGSHKRAQHRYVDVDQTVGGIFEETEPGTVNSVLAEVAEEPITKVYELNPAGWKPPSNFVDSVNPFGCITRSDGG